MLYLECKPSLPLAEFIRSLWYCRCPNPLHQRERVLPNGCVQIVISLAADALTDCDSRHDTRTAQAEDVPRLMASSILVGARARYDVIHTRDLAELVGIVIRPGGLGPWLRQRSDTFFEQSIALEDVWTEKDLRCHLQEAKTPDRKLAKLDSLLVESLRGRKVERRSLMKQATLLLLTESVRDTAQALAVSERRLQQIFNEDAGLSPKLWSRIRRFQQVVKALHTQEEVRWDELALRCGYYDQPHFANDFKAFSGIDPTTYSRSRGPWQNHVAIASFRILPSHRELAHGRMFSMGNVAKNCTATVIPGMRYRDALKMIDWLEKAFGFHKHAVYMAGDTTVAHAQMTFGNGMVMLGSVDNVSKASTTMVQPDEIGNRETQSACLIVSDCGPIYATAKAAGAEMIMELIEMEYGGKAFTCRDPEGHIWSIGEYDPWAES